MITEGKLKLILWAVLIYTVLVFGWWTYSLIDYNSKLYKASIVQLHTESKLAKYEMLQEALKGSFAKNGSLYSCRGDSFLINKNLILDFAQYNYRGKLDINFSEKNFQFENCLSIEPSSVEVEKLKHEKNRLQRAYISEVAFFLILLIASLVWLYKRLQTIINSNKQQNNFLLAVTHELKTPMATIMLSFDTLKRKIVASDSIKSVFQLGQEGIKRLENLVDDILLTTRLEGKNYKYESAPLNISQLLENIGVELQNRPSFVGEVDWEIDEDCFIKGDEKTIKIALSNLISNAVKYSQKTVRIHLSCKRQNKNVEIVVADEGRGIPKAERKNVFKRFYRFEDEDTRTTKGTGLGLNLVQKIVERHAGTIRIEDNIPEGTKFVINIKNNGKDFVS
jgi:signal transduction histidine kinase